MMRAVLGILREPRLDHCDVDGSELLRRHREILRGKPMIREVMREIYRLCRTLDQRHFSGTGQRIELGGGSSLMKDDYPEVVVTDIKDASSLLDRTLDAQAMDLPDASVRAFYGINCFHHFPSPQRFFEELTRTLSPGGGCILIEPYYGMMSRFLYPRLFASEGFDLRQATWDGAADQGVMSGANQALSYVVFERDCDEFRRRNPRPRIAHRQVLDNYMRYILSGGLNFRQLVPDFASPLIRACEWMAKPVHRMTALHHVIVIVKDGGGAGTTP